MYSTLEMKLVEKLRLESITYNVPLYFLVSEQGYQMTYVLEIRLGYLHF